MRSTKTRRVFGRILSVLLTLCMIASAFPLSVFAYDSADEEMTDTWRRMLEIGIVDADGEMNEYTRFDFADGRTAMSITEFLDMIDSEDTDPDMLVQVWGNGSEATIQEIVYALSIEYQMRDITSSIRYLAENDLSQPVAVYDDNAEVSNDEPQTEKNTTVPRLVWEKNNVFDDNILSIKFSLEDEEGEEITATEDITFNLGFYGDIEGVLNPSIVVANNQTLGELAGINENVTHTIEAGKAESYVIYDIDTLEQDLETVYDFYSRNPVSKRPDFLSGSLPFILQISNLEGAVIENDNGIWTDAATIKLSYERSEVSSVSFKYVYSQTQHAVTGDDLQVLGSGELSEINNLAGNVNENEKFKTGYVIDLTTDVLNLSQDDIEKMRLSNDAGIGNYLYARFGFSGAGNFNVIPKESDGFIDFYVKYSDGNWYHNYVRCSSSPQCSGSSDNFKYSSLEVGYSVYLPYDVEYSDGTEMNPGTITIGLPEQIAFVFREKNEAGASSDDRNNNHMEITSANSIYVSEVCLNDSDRQQSDAESVPNVPHSATVKNISIIGNQTEFSVGQCVPILVEFTEPVKGRYKLKLSDGSVLEQADSTSASDFIRINPDVTGSNDPISSTRLFLYEVKAIDNTEITVTGVSGASIYSTDIRNIKIKPYETSVTLTAKLNSTLPEHSIKELNISAQDLAGAAGRETVTYTLTAATDSRDQYKIMWGNYKPDVDGQFAAVAVLDGDFENAVVMQIEGDKLVLSADIEVPKNYTPSAVSHSVQLYIRRGDKYTPVNSYGTITVPSISKLPSDAYTITANKDRVYLTEGDAYITLEKKTGASYTYENDIEFVCEPSDAIRIEEKGGKYLIIPEKPGDVTVYVLAKNGSAEEENHNICSNEITIKVIAGSNPSIIFPQNANTYITRAGEDCTLRFASNLESLFGGDGAAAGKTISVQLKNSDDEVVYTESIPYNTNTVTIPGDYLTEISVNGKHAYSVVLTANVKAGTGAEEQEITATGYIIVIPQPAKVTLTLPGTALISDKEVDISWSVDDLKDGEVEFWIEKDGKKLFESTTGDLVTGNYSDSTSYSFTMSDDSSLKENYLIIARARNSGDDAWSTDSRIVTIYKNGALDIEIGGKKQDSFTLKNEVSSSGTTTNPTITNTSGDEIGGLKNAQAIAALRSELGLLESISINKSDFTWGTRSDMIKWSTDAKLGDEEDKSVLTLNYRQGTVYEPLSNFSYLAYIPEAVLMLCGLNEGTATVTAEHNSVEGLSDTVTVNVEKLKNKLYLFSFTPAVETKLTYTDGNGVVHNVTTNDDGSLALYEPNGIASDINCYSESNGEKYLGTIVKQTLKSGEGNGTKGELYPMNSVALRKAAVAEIILTKPDGTPYTGDVTIRGGVYRNLPYAENRDDAYCADAKFAIDSGTATLDGKSDMIFTADKNGKVSIYMDMTQFTTKNDSDPISFHEDVQYIFELRIDEYYPTLVTFDSNLTVKESMRKGENRVSLKEAKTPEIFVAAQTVDYGTGRKIKITDNTSRVGPNPTYTSAEFETTIMLWGVNTDGCDYDAVLRQQKVHKEFRDQTVIGTEEATYPFSSIKLIKNITTFDEDSFDRFNTDLIKAEYKIYDKNSGGIGCVISVRPRIANLINRERINESDNLLSLMANIKMFGAVNGNESSGGILNTVKDAGEKVVTSALEFVTGLGSETGTVKCVLTPTEDPARFTGYFWTGMNTLKMDDLEYDENGISFEPTLLDMQLNDTFSVSDFKSMADGSYFEDRSGLWGAAANGVIGLPVSLALEGWFSTDIRFNLDTGEWEILMTGGGFTAGAELQFETTKDVIVGPGIPLTYSVKLRGGVVVDFKTAIRYAEELSEGWDPDKAQTVNDYLTALRINAYIELFGGLGFGKKFTLKMGVFGSLEVNNENRFLTKNYLKSEDLKGQYLQLSGQVGFKAAIGIGPVELEITIASIGGESNWYFEKWKDIEKYWNGSDGEDEIDTQSLFMSVSSDPGYVVLGSEVRLQSRDYLDYGREEYFGESQISTYGARRAPSNFSDVNSVVLLMRNEYPYCAPILTDDAQLMVSMDDNRSKSIEDTGLSYSTLDDNKYTNFQPVENKENSEFPGYGDYTFDLDGTGNFAAATWIRQSVSLGLKAGTVITDDQQYALLNGNEVMVALWDGSNNWTTTRLTENSIREDSPVIAVSGDKKSAIVLWSQLQTGEEIGETINDAIMYKVYKDGKWSNEAKMLYNGDAGEVLDIDVKMLDDGTAAVAYSVSTDVSDPSGKEVYGSELYYSIIYTGDTDLTKAVKTVRVTDNTTADESPVITKTKLGEKEVFALAWHKYGKDTGVMQHDIGFLIFDKDGTPESNIPDSLSSSISLTNFDGVFDLTDGAENITDLSVVWSDRGKAEGSGNKRESDVMKAAKLVCYDNVYSFSAPIDAVEFNSTSGEQIQHISASYADGGISTAISTESATGETKTKKYEFVDADTNETIEYEIKVPVTETNLYAARSYLKNAVEVTDIMVDFSTLNTETPTPIAFTVTNMGIQKMTSLTIKIGDHEQKFDCELMPGEYSTFGTVYTTGKTIKDAKYTCTAVFDGEDSVETSGVVHLDYPDIGITGITVTKQSDGVREMNIGLYNQSAASLNKTGRSVTYRIYSDSECKKLIDKKYFKSGNNVVIDSSDKLTQIDEGTLTESVTFYIGEYLDDQGLVEIPSGGINLFVKADVLQNDNVLPESDKMNNTARINFESLVDIRGEKTSVDSYIKQTDTGTTVEVVLTNNSREESTGGNIVVALYSEDGVLLGTKRTYGKGNLDLGEEEVRKFEFEFDAVGSYVLVWFTDDTDEAPDSTKVNEIYLEGTDLTLESFGRNKYAELYDVESGTYSLTVITANPEARVYVDGVEAENGIIDIDFTSTRVYTITIVSPDGSSSTEYRLKLNTVLDDENGGIYGLIDYPIYCTLTFDTNGGSRIVPLRQLFRSTVDLSAFVPEREGYEFTGWYLDADLTKRVKTVQLTRNMTVYAGWEKLRADSVIDESNDDRTLPFIDVAEQDWFYDDVLYVYENGLMRGTGSDTFSPMASTTRAMIVTVLYRMEGEPESGDNIFDDVAEGEYYTDAVAWAAENGIVNGYGDGKFGPNDNITREQLAAILYRYSAYKGYDVTVGENTNILSYGDIAELSDYAFTAMQWACGAGLINGMGDGTLAPKSNASRCQIAAVLHRFCESVEE